MCGQKQGMIGNFADEKSKGHISVPNIIFMEKK
jgi:hypothetical protein